MEKILLIDDDFAVRKSISLLLENNGFKCVTAASPNEALEQWKKEFPDLVILDMNFGVRTGGEEGLNLLAQLKQKHPHLPVILITAWGSIRLAVAGMKAGAADFITKPWDNDHLIRSVRTSLELFDRSRNHDDISRKELDRNFDFSMIVGRDPVILKAMNVVARVSKTDATVLITGESGTGKEVFAEAIHRNSNRAGNAFIKVNLGGISSTLFESEMFGHKRGAFTDARFDRAGRFEHAHRGTIFLDEIGELDPGSQVKMLRVLQDRTFEVLGSSETRTVDTRVICATNKVLEEMVARSEFREDLFYRINLVTIKLPPLRERRNDIPLLADHVLSDLKKSYGRKDLNLSNAARDWLKDQRWPGNVRELKNLLERAIVVISKPIIDRNELSELAGEDIRAGMKEDKIIKAGKTLGEVEKELIISTLRKFNHNYSKAARSLGLSRGALYRRLEKYHIDHEDKS